jgi:hypothetical protein
VGIWCQAAVDPLAAAQSTRMAHSTGVAPQCCSSWPCARVVHPHIGLDCQLRRANNSACTGLAVCSKGGDRRLCCGALQSNWCPPPSDRCALRAGLGHGDVQLAPAGIAMQALRDDAQCETRGATAPAGAPAAHHACNTWHGQRLLEGVRVYGRLALWGCRLQRSNSGHCPHAGPSWGSFDDLL